MSEPIEARSRYETARRGILQSALGLYREIGHKKTNVADIARRSSMSPANVYRFFPSKRAIEQAVVAELSDLGLDVAGLMGVAAAGDLARARAQFAALAALRDRLGLAELSMGMSADLEAAVAEGATIVRVGSALFGPRPPRSG